MLRRPKMNTFQQNGVTMQKQQLLTQSTKKKRSERKQSVMKKHFISCLLFLGLVILFSTGVVAEDNKEVKAEVLALNLENPSGLAIHPETGDVFIASRYGIYRYQPKEHKMNIEIDNYATDVYGKGPRYNIGPLGLTFIDKNHLVVADGSRKDGEELVRIYKLTKGSVENKTKLKYAKEDSAAFTLGPIKASEKSKNGEGNFFGVTIGAGNIFVTCHGDDTKGWIAKSKFKDGKPGKLELFIATKEVLQVDAPSAIMMSADGEDLVVAQMGEITQAGDSLLVTYNPKDGKMRKKYTTGLNDIVGLAISPKTKKVYATDFSWIDTSKGGLFELTIDGDKITAKKILSLDKPSAIAFDKEGRLYLTVFGTAPKANVKKEETKKKVSPLAPGKLLRIDAGL
ncbi:hypothetical protein MNBD_PLANCTO02-1724 [hydrothermal vent metagenome]|uniref:SMP-30/Gluconolactonase/LRE-like region domain-containing protein n=1 Tax=hydrothermal vent metagenome TaxID=652676 RepID=A0A3B1DTW0_9ZZZZ